MRSSRTIKFIAVLAFVGIFVVGLTTAGFAQFGQKLGPQPSQASGDLATNTQGPEGSAPPAASFGQKLGPQPSQSSGDLSTNTQGAPGSSQPASSFGQKLGPQPSQASGDLSTNSAKPQ